jgi:hypothetical protein
MVGICNSQKEVFTGVVMETEQGVVNSMSRQLKKLVVFPKVCSIIHIHNCYKSKLYQKLSDDFSFSWRSNRFF